ncbi:N amino acid transport system protein [Vanrija pseudolonga]|uniref:N amino acid transport system protein n=1 Tax=Vanrija pseudolonga TaxID=143232 RepID=A0AAF0YAP7_9TREE|nr:N amino acid transport system protein [Vanrija pseudolonga]
MSTTHDNYDPEKQENTPYSSGKDQNYAVEVAPAGGVVQHDAVFSDMSEGGPNYRSLGMLGAFVLMTKANVGLGVLSIPFVFMSVGMVPGIILLIIMNMIIMYCALVIGDFKQNHPEMYAIADAGFIIGGKVGREYFGIAFLLFMIFVAGAGMVGVSTALNAVSTHGACTAIFIFVAAIAGWACASVRTLGKVAWLGWIGLVSILLAILILTIAVGVQDRPFAAPKTGPWEKNIHIFVAATFSDAMSSVNDVVFAFAATPAYFGIISEMRDPRQYKKAMVWSMGFVLILYLVIGVVVYHFCGQYVSSPALGSAGKLMKKVCYGVAIPALLVTLTIYAHLAAKYFFVRILAGSEDLTKPTRRHWTIWLGSTFATVAIAYLIASAIPIFGNLISLIGALIGPSVCIIPYNLMWWHDNWRFKESSQRNVVMAAVNGILLVIGVFVTIAGTYAAVQTIVHDKSRNKPWSCADNSHSV